MTLAELKSAVYRTAPGLGDFLDDEALVQYFNECQRLLAFDSQRLETKEVDVVDGTFTLPADCLVFKSASWEGRELSPWPGDSLPNIIPGYPAYYFQVGSTFYLIPKPSSGGAVSVFYIARSQDMQADNDIPSLANCDEVLVAYALWNVFKVMGEDDAGAEWRNNYLERRQAWLLLNKAENYKQTKVLNVFRHVWR